MAENASPALRAREVDTIEFDNILPIVHATQSADNIYVAKRTYFSLGEA